MLFNEHVSLLYPLVSITAYLSFSSIFVVQHAWSSSHRWDRRVDMDAMSYSSIESVRDRSRYFDLRAGRLFPSVLPVRRGECERFGGDAADVFPDLWVGSCA